VSEALGKLGDARAVEPLIAALRDGVWGVRSRAAEALGKIGNRRAVEPVIAALKDSDFSMWTAAEALGALGDARAVESLIVGLKDPWIRREAAEALRRIGTPEALAAVPSTRHRKRSERKTKCPTTS